MMKILFNKNEICLLKKTSLSEMLQLHYPENKNYSIAINQQFIPRTKYQEIFLNDKDIVDIISPMQGG